MYVPDKYDDFSLILIIAWRKRAMLYSPCDNSYLPYNISGNRKLDSILDYPAIFSPNPNWEPADAGNLAYISFKNDYLFA
jgi:hypothetical protein